MLIICAILFPMIAGTAVSLPKGWSYPIRCRWYALISLTSAVLGICTIFFGKRVTLFTFSENVTLTFSLDALGKFFLAAVLILYTCAAFYAMEYMKMEERRPVFFAFFYVSLGALTAVCASDNLVTVYLLAAVLVAIIGFGTKAGMYPMHGWLPSAHPIAPAPASALLSGIIAKAGVIAIIRLVYYGVGTDFIRGTYVQYTWMTLAMLTIFMGSMMAFQEKNMKKRLAYSTVSQISYILLALSLLSDGGLRGALLHVMSHASAKGCLFLCAGVFIYKFGKRNVDELVGIGKQIPVVMWCFLFAALSLVGIPPMGGFLSKWVIALSIADDGMKLLSILPIVILLISALLTAGYLFPVVFKAFFPGRDAQVPEVRDEAPWLMTVPMMFLCGVSLVMGVFGVQILQAAGF